MLDAAARMSCELCIACSTGATKCLIVLQLLSFLLNSAYCVCGYIKNMLWYTDTLIVGQTVWVWCGDVVQQVELCCYSRWCCRCVTVSSCPSCMSLYCWMRRIRSWRRLRSIWLSRVMSMRRWRVVDRRQGRTHLLALLPVDPAHLRCCQTYHTVPP